MEKQIKFVKTDDLLISSEDKRELEQKIRKMRKSYLSFSQTISELESYLEYELGHNWPESGEQKDLEDSFDKLEELFKFVEMSAERELESLSKII